VTRSAHGAPSPDRQPEPREHDWKSLTLKAEARVVALDGINRDLVAALTACRSQFESYALSHYRKRTSEGDEKAMTNQRFATLCDDALAKAAPLSARPDEGLGVPPDEPEILLTAPSIEGEDQGSASADLGFDGLVAASVDASPVGKGDTA
jgi:hypothetical protein